MQTCVFLLNGGYEIYEIYLDDVIKWKHFPRYWSFVRGIHRSPGHRWIPLTKASEAELWCFVWSTPQQTFEQTSDLRHHRPHYDVTNATTKHKKVQSMFWLDVLIRLMIIWHQWRIYLLNHIPTFPLSQKSLIFFCITHGHGAVQGDASDVIELFVHWLDLSHHNRSVVPYSNWSGYKRNGIKFYDSICSISWTDISYNDTSMV